MSQEIGAALWHDLECGSYEADLALWEELADAAGGPVLDIGAGTGRVALHLAERGHQVTGVDADAELTGVLSTRARQAALPVTAVALDARSFELDRRFALAIAPMQLTQLLGGPASRARMLARVRAHLEPGGLLAAALADPVEQFEPDSRPRLPRPRDADEWVLASTPLAMRSGERTIELDLHRQAWSPAGELSEEVVTIRLDQLGPDTFTQEGVAAGFQPRPQRRVPETRHHMGSTVVILEAPR
jgi:SAM-dependent methyltransferase